MIFNDELEGSAMVLYYMFTCTNPCGVMVNFCLAHTCGIIPRYVWNSQHLLCFVLILRIPSQSRDRLSPYAQGPAPIMPKPSQFDSPAAAGFALQSAAAHLEHNLDSRRVQSASADII